ncbi:tRNA (guanine(9)-N1)-methyltransferase [Babesia microti strain RI]|uniref:tRNA (guanine(9)-N(1))-methyltransferase n=1 Tax=Babesia microti (strain RI) TaxID=1133968 RepID=A0A0K3ANF2_BABMR|nr:tRNA (guanine(9)-N1)-methyltransferase [Babesia microti strain RI]CTQ41259.1 tRNA (guanine(9)-N1)-methyltransferase [Babesia microti strain RI]|eukprot:XP_012649270.1 tRNA (guanine(9)-N1)-methyltransferase [Babesia microti strain RI]
MDDITAQYLTKTNNTVSTTSIRRVVKAESYYHRCQGQCKIVVDCDFAHLINEKESKSLAIQIMQAYGASRRSDQPISLVIAGLKPGFLMKALSNISGYPNWLITLTSKSVDEICNSDNTVFLSADSSHSLTEIEASKTYVIGGIVDRNRHKGLFHSKANKLGFKSMRLPIREHINLTGSHILNVHSVFEIFLNYYKYNGNWQQALLNAIPQRKLSKQQIQTTEMV